MSDQQKPTFKDRLSAIAGAAKARAQAARVASEKTLTKLGISQKVASRLPKELDAAIVATWILQRVRNRNLAFFGRLITIVLCMFFLSDILALLLDSMIPEPIALNNRSSRFSAESSRKTSTEADYQSVIARNLFNLKDDTEVAPPTDQEPVLTTLPFTLVGTMILKNELRSLATIEDRTAQNVYPVRVQDEIPGKAKILSVTAQKVIFINLTNNQKEFVELPVDPIQAPKITISRPGRPTLGPGIEQLSNTQYSIARDSVDKAMGNLNEILTQARCVPNFENNAPSGFKCFQIVKGSIYDQLGMKDNDVICGINGTPINDIGKALEQLKEIQTASHIEICIKREGKVQNFAYDIH